MEPLPRAKERPVAVEGAGLGVVTTCGGGLSAGAKQPRGFPGHLDPAFTEVGGAPGAWERH